MAEPAQLLKLAFVVPRFGKEIVGGAELLALRLAERLAAAGHAVDIVTTCALDHYTWANSVPPGTETFGDLTIRRFLATGRDLGVHAELERGIVDGLRLGDEEQELWLRNGVSSVDMEEFLTGATYDAIFPLPYLFGTTYFAFRARPDISIPIPCLHDEAYAYLGFVQDMLSRAKGVMFNALPEARLAQQISPRLTQWNVVGMGFDEFPPSDVAAFRSRHSLNNPYVLYVGRREHGKNTPKLIDYFLRYKARNPGSLELVLVGSGDVSIPKRPDVRDLKVDWGEAPSMYRAASLFCQPSVNESFSIVLMQAWLAERPVLVHGACAVTRDHAERSDGGLWFSNFAEFELTLKRLVEDADFASGLGRSGKGFVLSEYSWAAVLERFHSSLYEWLGSRDEARL